MKLYVLKHKDLDVAMLQLDTFTGAIEYILDIYMPEELPLGCGEDGRGLTEWWRSRAIPDSRKGIQQVLRYLHEESSQSLMLSAFGLSLTDHYWMQPIDCELYWKNLNFYENDFSDELGNLLSDSGKIDADDNISKFSPSSSVNGEMKKKWVIKDGIRYLLKISTEHYGQQAVNEVIACRLHELLGWTNYVPYTIEAVLFEGKRYPCSLNPIFTSVEREFVPAYQLIRDYKVPNEISEYEAIIQLAAAYGMDSADVRCHLEYTILTDFILSNTDRHYNNFGFLYDSQMHKLVEMAPIFDTGNALFYDREIIPVKQGLLEVRVNSFSKHEVKLLQYVKDPGRIPLARLDGFPEEAQRLLLEYTDMPEARAERIAQTIKSKIAYLGLFAQGKKIWKREEYW